MRSVRLTPPRVATVARLARRRINAMRRNSSRRANELAFLPAALEIAETPPSPVGRAIGATIILLFCVAVSWAWAGTIDIVAATTGKIVPSGRTKVIQPFETGVVRSIRVQDGQAVKTGDVLIELDPTVNAAERDHLHNDLLAEQLNIARLHAALAGADDPTAAFHPPAGAGAALTSAQRQLLLNQVTEHRARMASLARQQAQKEAEQSTIVATIHKLEATIPVIQQRVDIRKTLMFLASIAGFGLVQQQFFPTSTRTELFFEMRLPEGTAIGVTEATAKKAEQLIGNDPDVASYTTYVGAGAPRFWLGLNPELPNANFAQIVIVAKDLDGRERLKARLEKAIADGALTQARARVDRFVFGPPVGFPVQFRVIGPDPLKVRAIAEDVRKVMAENHKLIDPHLDWNEQVKSIRLDIDQDRARALGLTPQEVAQTLQTLVSGYTITQYREGIERIGVVARAIPSERLDLDRLPALTIATRNGVAVPLSQVAKLSYEFEEPILWRRNRDLVLTVRSDVIDGVQAPDVSNEVAPKLKSIKDALPYGYRIETGGSIEESVKANVALVAVFPVMIIAMLVLLMIQLQSFSRLALVVVTAPLGLIGATGALLISNRPFGFVALLGLIALAGMFEQISRGRSRDARAATLRPTDES